MICLFVFFFVVLGTIPEHTLLQPYNIWCHFLIFLKKFYLLRRLRI